MNPIKEERLDKLSQFSIRKCLSFILRHEFHVQSSRWQQKGPSLKWKKKKVEYCWQPNISSEFLDMDPLLLYYA